MSQGLFTRTRIAPTPSGYLHAGNVLSFVITAALARTHGAKILLRIDDMDQARVNPDYVQDFFNTLDFLEIPWDEGPRDYSAYKNEWSQLRRIEHYQALLQRLKAQDLVFACTCSRSQVRAASSNDSYPGTCLQKKLPLDTPDCTWRLKTEASKKIGVNTLTEGIIETSLPPDMQYFVVRKKDGFPAYQLSSVADDLYFGVDLIVRGQDLQSSTLAQLYLADILGLDAFTAATFYHHGLITAPSGIKLSKSAGDTSVQSMRKQGKTAKKVFTAIAGMIGIDGQVENWQQLAGSILT